MSILSQEFYINNSIVHALSSGGDQKKMVVLLHGFPFNANMWLPQLERPAYGWQYLAIDFPGYGLSDAPAQIDILSYANMVGQLLQNFKDKKVVVAGLSMGGYVALALYSLGYVSLNGLVLCHTQATADNDQVKAHRLLTGRSIRMYGMEQYAVDSLKKLFGASAQSQRPELLDYFAIMMAKAKVPVVLSTLKALASRSDYTQVLQQITIPTLIIAGSEDKIISKEKIAQLQTIKGSSVFWIQQAGHLSNWEQSHEFNEVLNNFLKTI